MGSAPYVEPTMEQAKANIKLVLELAQKHGCHVDFHLDYNLDPASEPLIFEVISSAKKLSWSRESRITIGHATRLQLFAPAEWRDLVAAIGDLPVTFVGLPQSDIYMLGRQQADSPLGAPRGTLRIPHLANEYGVEMAMAVNNAQNAFTPQGSVDPLSLCALGVALFQSATPGDLRTLVVGIHHCVWIVGRHPCLLAVRFPASRDLGFEACYRAKGQGCAPRFVYRPGRPC